MDTQAAALKAESQASAKQTPESKPVDKAPATKSPPVESKTPEKKAAPPSTAKDAKAPPKYTREMAQSDTDESNKKRGKSLGGLFVRKKATNDDAADDAAQDEPIDKSKGDDPDEALLATLDEKTAQAIRIKRRLLNKSVRELLDEMK